MIKPMLEEAEYYLRIRNEVTEGVRRVKINRTVLLY